MSPGDDAVLMTTTDLDPAARASRSGTDHPADLLSGAASPPESDSDSSTASTETARIGWLDILRGVALCGILFVNIPPLLGLEPGVVDGVVQPTRSVLDLWVQGRFFPIFSWLFGLGFGLMWLSARRRTDRPRRALLQRIGVLAVFGAAHATLQPGEALLPYAVAALVVLLPATWAPRWLPVVAGSVLAVAAAPLGGLALIPGLFLLGFGLAQYDLPAVLERRPWIAALALVGLVPAAAFAAVGQLADPVSAGFTAVSQVAGLLIACCYVAGVIALTAVPGVRRVLSTLFAPLGRTALTNYIGATLLVLAIGAVREPLGIPVSGEASWSAAMLIAAGVLLLQWCVSTAWLARWGRGPLESLWRRLTWAGVSVRPNAGHL